VRFSLSRVFRCTRKVASLESVTDRSQSLSEVSHDIQKDYVPAVREVAYDRSTDIGADDRSSSYWPDWLPSPSPSSQLKSRSNWPSVSASSPPSSSLGSICRRVHRPVVFAVQTAGVLRCSFPEYPCRPTQSVAAQTDSRKFFSMISCPTAVSTLSGWNWTHSRGCSRWRTPITSVWSPCSAVADTSKQSGTSVAISE